MDVACEPVPRIPKPNLHQQKILLCVWRITAGTIYVMSFSIGQMIITDVYSDQLQRVQDELFRKQLSLVNRKSIVFLQDNARPHTVKVTRNKLNSLGWEILSPYSPDFHRLIRRLFTFSCLWITHGRSKIQKSRGTRKRVEQFLCL